MGLYLCVFGSDDIDDELDGVDVGSYDDFHDFRQTVCDRLEGGSWGSRYPILMNHSDSDGEWPPTAAFDLSHELESIQHGLRQLGPEPASGWRGEAVRRNGTPQSLDDCYLDVDGERLTERLAGLARLATARGRPINFQ